MAARAGRCMCKFETLQCPKAKLVSSSISTHAFQCSLSDTYRTETLSLAGRPCRCTRGSTRTPPAPSRPAISCPTRARAAPAAQRPSRRGTRVKVRVRVGSRSFAAPLPLTSPPHCRQGACGRRHTVDGDRKRGGLEDDLDVLLGRGRFQGEADDDLRLAVLAGLFVTAEERSGGYHVVVHVRGILYRFDSAPGDALVLLAVGTTLLLARVLGSRVSL
eukprot:scaffold119345_cov72-Phaeocystis_antarctica.AAC.1